MNIFVIICNVDVIYYDKIDTDNDIIVTCDPSKNIIYSYQEIRKHPRKGYDITNITSLFKEYITMDETEKLLAFINSLTKEEVDIIIKSLPKLISLSELQDRPCPLEQTVQTE